MTTAEVLAALKASGTAQTAKTYRRHGATGEVYGVSYVEFGKLKKKLKVDEALAEGLWASGKVEARVLATMIGDPASISEATLDSWSRDLDNYGITDAFAGFVAKTPFAKAKMNGWMDADHERLECAGWQLLSHFALTDSSLPDSFFATYLERIERNLNSAKNRVRYSMNGAVISIGLRSAALEKKAIAAARRIGKVEVDHGDTWCRTPDAESYILKARARKMA